MGSDDESKLAAPKLFGRKKGGRTPAAAPESVTPAEPEPTAVLEPTPASAPEAATPASAPEATTPANPVQPVQPVGPAEPVRSATPAREPKPPKPARTAPILSGMQAAAFAGLLVGAFLVLATFGSLNLCSTVRGASTCGGGAGFPLLLAIGIVAVVGGGTLLRLFRVSSPMSDSFLAVALVAVLTVLFLHNHYDAWWMIIAVPVLSILAFLLAHWVSATYIDPMDD